ncbi:ATP-binding protein [Candidatus Woesearchaeota archaeon]|nr:ATP-binding protein [Candidatus Woesearchaeota archaeon]
MSEFDIIWHRYNLKQNPYFTEPLTIEGSIVPIETLVGRDKEKEDITTNISLGGGTRFLVIGEAGVGKTSLVNFVRARARKNLFFSPINEIKVQDDWTPTLLVIDVLQNIYSETKSHGIKIQNNNLLKTLEDLFELSRIVEADDINPEAVLSISLSQATRLYEDLVREIINAGGYKAIIIHFNNLDNLDEAENYDKLFNNLRDFFQNKHSIFIFVGSEFIYNIINYRPKVRQIFVNVPIEIGKLSINEMKMLIKKRISYMRIGNRDYIEPHSEEALKLLYTLYDGNARDILNSLSTSVQHLKDRNTPTFIEEVKLKEILFNVANEMLLKKISPNEQKVLNEIIRLKKTTNSELANTLQKQRQHISSYLSKLLDIRAVKVDFIEGTKKYYSPTAEALWLKFKVTEKEIKERRTKELNKIEQVQQSLKKYLG